MKISKTDVELVLKEMNSLKRMIKYCEKQEDKDAIYKKYLELRKIVEEFITTPLNAFGIQQCNRDDE